MIFVDVKWWASNNLNLDLYDRAYSEFSFFGENQPMPPACFVAGEYAQRTSCFGFNWDTAGERIGLPYVEFEAKVGETLRFVAGGSSFAIFGGGQSGGQPQYASFGAARNAFFGSFESSIVDPEGKLRIVFEITEDADGDGIPDDIDPCPFDPANDSDSDGRCGDIDNCPFVAKPDQADVDEDGVGDACDNCVCVLNPGQEDGDSAGTVCDVLDQVEFGLCLAGPNVLVPTESVVCLPAIGQICI